MNRACLLVLLIATQTISAGAAKVDVAKVETELRRLEEVRRQAIKEGDETTLNEIYDDEFSAIAGNGQVIGKSQLMMVFKRNDPTISFTTDDINVRVFGDTALFVGRLRGRTADGTLVSASRFTHVFVKRGGKWRCVAGQSTPLPKD